MVTLQTSEFIAPPTATPARSLLRCGLVAGPLFGVVAAAQILTRPGFDLRSHPLSALSLGDYGWVQIANFVLTGLLVIAMAVGARRVLEGRASTAGPILIGIFGAGLVAAGVFVADAAYGFPAGTPGGPPATFSGHGIAHGVAAAVAFLSLTAACVVFARRFAAMHQRRWFAFSVVTAAAVVLLSVPAPQGASIRLAIASVLAFTWLTAFAHSMRRVHN